MTVPPRSEDLSDEEIKRLRVEESESRVLRRPWQLRGPQEDPEVTHWRGQPRRKSACGGKGGFRRRGGKKLKRYTELAAQSQGT